MIKAAVIVPTCRKRENMQFLVELIRSVTPAEFPVFATCLNSSAAVNRNHGMMRFEEAESFIMVDDDIAGFFPGWAEKLLEPLTGHVGMVSARLMRPDWSPGIMMNYPVNLSDELYEAGDKILPSAAIAFKNTGIFFDEKYVASGFEDTDYCFQLNQQNPATRYIIHNGVKLIHFNEQKGQGEVWQANKAYFHEKWGLPS